MGVCGVGGGGCRRTFAVPGGTLVEPVHPREQHLQQLQRRQLREGSTPSAPPTAVASSGSASGSSPSDHSTRTQPAGQRLHDVAGELRETVGKPPRAAAPPWRLVATAASRAHTTRAGAGRGGRTVPARLELLTTERSRVCPMPFTSCNATTTPTQHVWQRRVLLHALRRRLRALQHQRHSPVVPSPGRQGYRRSTSASIAPTQAPRPRLVRGLSRWSFPNRAKREDKWVQMPTLILDG